MNSRALTLGSLLGTHGSTIASAMQAGQHFLQRHATADLLRQVGQTIAEIPAFEAIKKNALQDSYGGNQTSPSDDLLVGQGLFYLTEQRRLFLDCTSGHYQMLWGYNHPELNDTIAAALRHGVVWDNHSNIPQAPLKQLAHRLVEAANAPAEARPLDTVLLGICTGSVACAAALKIQLRVFEKARGNKATPVIVTLEGNYHGTDMIPQFMRGMWSDLLRGVEVVSLPPNDNDALEAAFRLHGRRVAGFWAEPVMMNREALAVNVDYLQAARRWCDEVGALLCIDEIQTGFWQPEYFACRALGIRPDLIVAGKGMTAGFHPLSALIYHHDHDVLAQYDAISTNGSAALPALVALASMELITERAAAIRDAAQRIERGLRQLAVDFPDVLETAQGRGHLSGLRFRRVENALEFHRRAVQAGLWVRAHAYHAGHRTVLTKLGLLAEAEVIDFMLGVFRRLLQSLRPDSASTASACPPS